MRTIASIRQPRTRCCSDRATMTTTVRTGASIIHPLVSDSSSYEKEEGSEGEPQEMDSIERNPSLLVCCERCRLTRRIRCRGVAHGIKRTQTIRYPLTPLW